MMTETKTKLGKEAKLRRTEKRHYSELYVTTGTLVGRFLYNYSEFDLPSFYYTSTFQP